MRILVVSDSHGDFNNLKKAIAAQPAAEYIIHCGDGCREIGELKPVYGDRLIAVRGNCDLSSDLPDIETVTLGGKKIYVTHGHLFNAKLSIYSLICAAREQKADILLFGHTHLALEEYDEGMYILNPGSCRGYGGTYGYIDITDKGDIVTNIVKIK